LLDPLIATPRSQPAREPRTQDYDEAQWRGEKVASTVRGNRPGGSSGSATLLFV